jgi:hypothetical protein
MSENGTSGKPKGIAYYHCPNRSGCGKYCEMVELEERIAKKFLDLHFSDDFIALVIEKTRVSLLNGRDKYEGRRQGLVNRKTAFEARLKSAEDKLIEGVLSNDDFKRIREENKGKINQIEEELLRLKNEREVDIDVVQEVLLLTKDIYSAYKGASFDLKRQYLGFFWERFEVANGVILKSVPSPLFGQLLEAEKAFVDSSKTEKALDKALNSDVILTKLRLRG